MKLGDLPRVAINRYWDTQASGHRLRVDVWTVTGQSSKTCSTYGETQVFAAGCIAKAAKRLAVTTNA